MDLRRLIAQARSWLPLLVVVGLLAGFAAFVVSSLLPKVYESKATLIVGQSLSAANPDYSQLLVAQGLSSTYASIAKTRPILESVIAELQLDETTDALANRIKVQTPLDSSLLEITVSDTDSARSAAIANALGGRLIEASPTIQGREAELQRSIDDDLTATQDLIESTQERISALSKLEQRTPQQEAELQALEGRLVTLRSTYATLLSFSSANAANQLSLVEPAATPASPVSPNVLLNTILGLAIGLLAVAGIAFVAEQLDDSVRDPEAVEGITRLSTLAAIPRIRTERGRSAIYQLVTLLFPRSSAAEAYRTLRVNVEFAALDAQLHTLLVTSAAPDEGKTTTACNLAVVFAQAGRRVLLVDADLRKPGVHLVFDLLNAHGLTTMLRGEGVDPASVSSPTEQPNLRVLTTGPLPPNPAELLGSHRMQAVLAQLQAAADLVIFDSPPLQAVTDAAVLAAFTDGTLLVVDATRSRRRMVQAGREALARAGASVLGAVLNRAAAEESLEYAGYYGRAESGRPTTPTAPVTPATTNGGSGSATASRKG